jgi:hypothetical protein
MGRRYKVQGARYKLGHSFSLEIAAYVEDIERQVSKLYKGLR